MDNTKQDKTENRTHSYQALRILASSIFIGMLAVILYSFQRGGPDKFFSVAMVSVLLGSASLVIGALLGFLFGIPKTLQQDGNNAQGDTDDSTQADSQPKGLGYKVNTNLEQISDWLTKMIVGVGLTQLYIVPSKLRDLTHFIAKGMGGDQSDQIFALTVILFFVIVGFLFGYLWTRLFLAGALRRADLSAIGVLQHKLKEADEKISQVRNQREWDVEALNMATLQLNPSPELKRITQDQLNAAIESTSRPVRAQIFYMAWDIRSENWQHPENKPKMELTIPIFKALINSDKEKRYHMNYGQLGFALKDKREPEWAEAETALSTAIEIRGDWHDNGWLFYEFARAICRINLDEAFLKGKPSDPLTREDILKDLQAASHADLFGIMESIPEIVRWMKINNISKSKIVNG